jgi:hypothetical protein
MAYLKIATFWHASAGCGIAEGERASPVVVYPNGGGYGSLKEMQQELKRRNRDRKPELLPKGIRVEADCGRYQEITWEETRSGN